MPANLRVRALHYVVITRPPYSATYLLPQTYSAQAHRLFLSLQRDPIKAHHSPLSGSPQLCSTLLRLVGSAKVRAAAVRVEVRRLRSNPSELAGAQWRGPGDAIDAM